MLSIISSLKVAISVSVKELAHFCCRNRFSELNASLLEETLISFELLIRCRVVLTGIPLEGLLKSQGKFDGLIRSFKDGAVYP